jgi:hypothetical protein
LLTILDCVTVLWRKVPADARGVKSGKNPERCCQGGQARLPPPCSPLLRHVRYVRTTAGSR